VTTEGAELEKRTGRPRDPGVDEAVSRAVFKVLAECGMSGFTVGKVAACAGVGKATVYRRWPSRDDLIQEVWERIHDELPKPDTGDVRTDLELFLGALVDHMADPERRVAISHLVTAAKVDPELGARFHAFKQQRVEALRAIVRRAEDRGELRSGLDEDAVVEMIVAGIFYRIMVGGGALDRQYAQHCIDIVLDGIVEPTTVGDHRT
jgi:AcrR family transcriptional regulator